LRAFGKKKDRTLVLGVLSSFFPNALRRAAENGISRYWQNADHLAHLLAARHFQVTVCAAEPDDHGG
jgi:hypothetical protein